MSPRRKPTYLEVAVENVGVLKAGRALAYLVTWTWAVEKYGPECTAEQFAEYFKMSRATAFRHRSAILDAFDGYDIDRLVGHIVLDLHDDTEFRRTQRGAVKASRQVAGLQVPA